MSTFKDNTGRAWTIPHFDPYLADDVHQATNVSLYTITQDNLAPIRELFTNRPVFWNVIFVLVAERVKERGLTDREFAQAMAGGDCLDAAQEAFWDEVLFFSPEKERKLLIEMMAKAKELQATLIGKASQEITTIMQKLFGDLSDSPASNPAA